MTTLYKALRDSLKSIDAEGMHPNFDEWRDDEVNDLITDFMCRVKSGEAAKEIEDAFCELSADWSIKDLSNGNIVLETLLKVFRQHHEICRMVPEWIAENSIVRGVA